MREHQRNDNAKYIATAIGVAGVTLMGATLFAAPTRIPAPWKIRSGMRS